MPSTPPATPGRWASVLGIFSTAKKKPPPSSVDSSTNDTDMEKADLSRLTEEGYDQHGSTAKSTGLASASSTPGDNFMSPMSPNSVTGKHSSSRRSNGARKSPKLDITALQHRTSQPHSRLQNGSLPAQNQLFMASEKPTLGNSTPKSPWQNRGGAFQKTTSNATSLAPSPWHGRRSHAEASSRSLVQVPVASNPRARNYRPNAVGLVGSRPGRRYRRAGEFNQERVSQALDQLKGSFLTTIPRDPCTSVYAVKGKVQYGSSSRASRLPPPTLKSQKRQRSEQTPRQKGEYEDNEEDHEEQSRKKQKKVSFNRDEDEDDGAAVVQKVTATSFAATPAGKFKSAANRKGTPMPPRQSAETPEPPSAGASSRGSGGTETPSSTVTETLPEKPPGINFVLGAPLEFTATVETFDPPMLDPALQALAFDWTPKGPLPKTATRTYQDGADWDSARFEKPPSLPGKPASSPGMFDDQEAQQPVSKRTKKNSFVDDQDIPDWQCSKCKKYNKHDESKCTDKNCGTVRGAGLKTEGWGNLFANQNVNKWTCASCLVKNDNSVSKCPSCETPKPGHEGETKETPAPAPANPSEGQSPPKVSFPFKTTPAGSSKFNFGAPTGTLPVPSGQAQGGSGSMFTWSAQSSTGSSGGFNISTTKSDSKQENRQTESAPTPAPGGFVLKQGGSSEINSASSQNIFGTGSNVDSSDAAPASAQNEFKGFTVPSAPTTKTNSESNSWNTTSSTKTPASAPVPDGTKPSESAGTNSFSTGAFGMSADAKPFQPAGENGNESSSGMKQFGVKGSSKEHEAGENSSSNQGELPQSSSTAAGLFGSFGSSNAGPANRSRGYDLGETKVPSQTKASAPSASSDEPTTKVDNSQTQPAPTFGSASTSAPETASVSAAPGPSGNLFSSSSFASAQDQDKGVFNAPSSAQEDGNSSASFAGGAQSGPALFGAPAGAAPTGSIPFPFGNTTGSSGAGFGGGFGASNSAPFGNSNGGATAPSAGSKTDFQFPATSQGTTPAGETPSTVFGEGTTPAPAPSISFGAGNTPAAAAPSASFGAGNTPSAAPSSFGGSSAPQFGSNATPAPAPPAQSFGTNSSSSVQPNITFPSASTPAFNAPPPQASGPAQGFGATQQQPSATPAPGAANFGFTPAFGSAQASTFGSVQTPSFGAAQPSGMSAPGFGSTPGGGGLAFNNPAAFGSSTPAPSGGSMSGGFGAGGFSSQQTPAPAGSFGGGFNPTPNTAPGTGFSIGTADPSSKNKPRRRMVRAKRPQRN